MRTALGAAGIAVTVAVTGGSSGRTMRVHLGSGLVTCKVAGSTEEPIASRSHFDPQGGSMNDVLSNDQVAALVEAARSGNVPADEPSGAEAAGAARARDRLLPPEQVRASTSCAGSSAPTRRAAGRRRRGSPTELLTPVELDVLGIDQLDLVVAR